MTVEKSGYLPDQLNTMTLDWHEEQQWPEQTDYDVVRDCQAWRQWRERLQGVVARRGDGGVVLVRRGDSGLRHWRVWRAAWEGGTRCTYPCPGGVGGVSGVGGYTHTVLAGQRITPADEVVCVCTCVCADHCYGHSVPRPASRQAHPDPQPFLRIIKVVQKNRINCALLLCVTCTPCVAWLIPVWSRVRKSRVTGTSMCPLKCVNMSKHTAVALVSASLANDGPHAYAPCNMFPLVCACAHLHSAHVCARVFACAPAVRTSKTERSLRQSLSQRTTNGKKPRTARCAAPRVRFGRVRARICWSGLCIRRCVCVCARARVCVCVRART